MTTLSPKQKLIVTAPIGVPIQVLASAGSGKTRVLTERVRYILEHTKKDCVVALTFTNAAAKEMQSRLTDIDDIEERSWIATIHSVAQRILEQYSHTIDLPSDLHIYERDADRMEVFMQSLRDDGKDIDKYLNVKSAKEKRNRQQVLRTYMDHFSNIKRELLSEDEIKTRYPNIPTLYKIYQDYQNSLLASGGIDYDDILLYAHKLLLTHDWIADIYRAKYKHLCVDEAQDLNKVQYEFIKVLCGKSIRSILMVGDPNQMIYGFNGSSSDYLCQDFINDFSPQCLDLKENYRSTTAVINAANKLKPNSQTEHDFALDGKVTIESFENEEAEADWVISNIERLIALKHHDEIEGEISLDRMVVIARNRFIFSKLENALKEKDVPYYLRKGERRTEYTSIFGRVLDYAVRIKLNHKDWVDGKKLCALLKTKAPDKWDNPNVLSELSSQLLDSDLFIPELQSELLQAVYLLDSETPNIRKFVRHFDLKLKEIASNDSNEQNKLELERSIDELQGFGNDWTNFKRRGLGDSLQSFRNATALGQLTSDEATSGLALSTVHTMKGLEKDIVFLIGMCEGVFPDYRANTSQEIEEERNSAFVAVTRAKRWLYISYPRQRLMPWGDSRFQSQSRFLTEIQS